MYNRHSYSPVYEFNGKVTTARKCEKCLVPILRLESREEYSYYIGDHRVEVVAYVTKGECPRCGGKWETSNARELRNEAFREGIDRFWKEQIEEIGVNNTEMASVMYVISRLMMKLGEEKKRQVASELGRWLCDCAFLTK